MPRGWTDGRIDADAAVWASGLAQTVAALQSWSVRPSVRPSGKAWLWSLAGCFKKEEDERRILTRQTDKHHDTANAMLRLAVSWGFFSQLFSCAFSLWFIVEIVELCVGDALSLLARSGGKSAFHCHRYLSETSALCSLSLSHGSEFR